jgi:hypothetical protein
MPPIEGKLTGNANYRTLPIVHPDTRVDTVKTNTVVTLSGFAGVVTEGLSPLWYRVDIDANHRGFWIHSSLIARLNEGSLNDLPFIDVSQLPNPGGLPFQIVSKVNLLLADIGVTIADNEVIDEALASAVNTQINRYGTRLKGTWTKDTLQEAVKIIDHLAEYAVILHGSGGAGWLLEEMHLVRDAIDMIAGRVLVHFERRFPGGVPDQAAPFRLLYGPLRMVRDERNNLHPSPDPVTGKPVWWAKNPQGFETFFGNFTFTGVSLKFKPIHLVIHEVEHCLNQRYRIGNSAPASVYISQGRYTIPADESSTGNAINVDFENINDGYSPNIRPRSSDDPWEVVTDAFTNDASSGYLDGTEGEARASQVRALMKGVIEYRVLEYGAARIRVRNQQDATLESRLEPALTLLELNEAADLAHFANLL